MKHVCSLEKKPDPGIYNTAAMEPNWIESDIGAAGYDFEKTLTLEEKFKYITHPETGHYSFIDGDFILDNKLEDGRYTVTLNAIETIALFRKDPKGRYLCNNGYLRIGGFLRHHMPDTIVCGYSPYPHGVMVFLAEKEPTPNPPDCYEI